MSFASIALLFWGSGSRGGMGWRNFFPWLETIDNRSVMLNLIIQSTDQNLYSETLLHS